MTVFVQAAMLLRNLTY